MISTGAGAERCNSLRARRSTSRFLPTGRKLAGRGAGGRGGIARSASSRQIRVIRFDRRNPACTEAKPGEDRIGQRHRPQQPRDVVTGLCRQQEAHSGRAIGESGGDAFQSDLRNLVDRKRQHICRQPIAEPRQRVDQRRAVRLIMKQHDGPFAAGLAIGDQHRAQPAHQRVFRRQRIGCRAGRAGGRALAAARADICVDRHMVSRGADGARRTEVETPGATRPLRTRVSAQPGFKIDVARLLEGADEIARLENSLQHRRWIAGIRAQIAVAQIGSGKQRGATGQIKDDVAGRAGVVARGPEGQYAARGRRGLGEIVDHDLKCAKMPFGAGHLAFRHRKYGAAWRRNGSRRLDQYGNVEMILEQVAGLDRGLVSTADRE